MAWLKLDDNYTEHPKVQNLSDKAFRLHVAAMTYVAKFGLDGLISKAQASTRPGFHPKAINELLDGGLWHPGGEGCGTKECPTGKRDHYVIHDFLQWNETAAWWEERARREAERKAKYRAEKRAEREVANRAS